MSQNRSALFRGRHFEDVIIILCVRWYLRYSLTYRDLEEMMAERGLSVDHGTIWRWVQHYAPILNQRLRPELRHPNRSWRVDESYVRVAGKWAYLYRAVDSAGDTIEFTVGYGSNSDFQGDATGLDVTIDPAGRKNSYVIPVPPPVWWMIATFCACSIIPSIESGTLSTKHAAS